MAKAAATPDEAGADAPKKKGNKMLVIIIALLVVVILGGAAAFFMMGGSHADEGEDGEEVVAEDDHEAAAKEAKKAKLKKKKDAEAKGLPPVFVELDPFTVNLQPETAVDQYLQVKATLRVDEQPAADNLKAYMPEIRHRVLMLLSGKKASELGSAEGREQLAEDIKHAVNAIVGEVPRNRKGEPEEPIGPVESVLFTSFIVQ
ncbi:MAG: flagellar basal body-associated protein FliL [Methyloversatilis sp.]|jgi:flagellar FliL protein|uniref:flagellar basal body-associated protein FliL n=1 Tax=Methyloversatilis TaxID=378210 RepID=UPI0025F8ECB6|nr:MULTISPECIES: flagellar basal body-associated protein FliL [Methyloversatilis]MBT9516491.1 flagellar basal body-associated protein FliL [Methyloversatilis discipulorum]MBV5287003.1 flagellar basal body-associated protein FliL [Methyloversatilis discipulorum]MCR6667248.1 flagellar basal body-associated protein FliL [Methyloversatilis sp.]MDY0056345.1 flagellar basal body-associated protein FliL [Methyloversatilis sp.]